MPDLDPDFTALPLSALADAALSRAAELGCSHADVRVERLREAYRSFRDHALESSSGRPDPRPVGPGGARRGLGLRRRHRADHATPRPGWPSGRSPPRKVSRPLTPASVELADEPVYAGRDLGVGVRARTRSTWTKRSKPAAAAS